jgi:signal transduction histidine kinase
MLQVLVNLIGNAIKFSPASSRVALGAEQRSAGGVRVYVTDQGQGIASKDLERLFRKFSQVDGSSTRVQGGTGLGLAICKAIVEEHGGTIGVVSEIGRGSTFWFDLPDGGGVEALKAIG